MSAPAADMASAARDSDPDQVLAEGRRVMELCRVCGYCTGLCPVFPALERSPSLATADLDYLANLCHNCRACWYACQYAPPHEFAINVPATLARLRAGTYRRYAWPSAVGRWTGKAAATAAVAVATSLLLPLLTLLWVPRGQLFAVHRDAGAFYAVIPWGVMTTVATLTLGWALLAATIGLARFWRDIAPRAPAIGRRRALLAAARDLLTLRHLDGGGPGCNDRDGSFTQARRIAHLILFYGLLLCLAATATAALFHHLLGQPAPYPLASAPVLLGTLGGIAMLVGIGGLLRVKHRADPAPTATETLAADHVLLAQLFAVAASGLLLLALRETAAMGLLLALHLGTVLGLFATLPYGKLIHGAYRGAALLRAALEGRRHDDRRRTAPPDRSETG